MNKTHQFIDVYVHHEHINYWCNVDLGKIMYLTASYYII